MKYYKGFNSDLTCRGFQYKEGETYKTDKAELCRTGFHACERPLDAISYYSPSRAVYHAVELGDVETDDESSDTKVCSTEITIKNKLSIKELMSAEYKYAKEHDNVIPPVAYVPGNKVSEACDCGLAYVSDSSMAISRECGKAIAGHDSIAYAESNGLACSGRNSVSRTGTDGISITESHGLALSGNHGISIGNAWGATVSAGKYGIAIGRTVTKVGDNGVIIVPHNDFSYVMGGIDSVVVVMDKHKHHVFTIDGEKYKPDTLYMIGFDDDLELDLIEVGGDISILNTWGFTEDPSSDE